MTFICVYTSVGMWRSEDNQGELVLSFHLESPGDQTQVVKLGRKGPYVLSLFDGFEKF